MRNRRNFVPKGRTLVSIEDPFKFDDFGRFHYIIYSILCFIILQTSWFIFLLHIYTLNFAYCASPANVTDYCSKECKQVDFNRDIIDENYTTEFRWICERDQRIKFFHLCFYIGTLCGAIFYAVTKKWIKGRTSIIASLVTLLISDSATVFWSNEYLVYAQMLISCFCGAFIFMEAQMLLLEISPTWAFDIGVALISVSFLFGALQYAVFWTWMRNWRLVRIIKIIFYLITVFLANRVVESPRFLFSSDNTQGSIEVLEYIAKINKESDEGIRENVERAWRLTRTRPKSRDSFLGLFYYPLSRNLFIKTCFVSFIAGSVLKRGIVSKDISNENVYLETMANTLFTMFGHICFLIVSKLFYRKTVLVSCLIWCAIFFFTSTIYPDGIIHMFVIKFSIIPGAFLVNVLDTMTLELFPTSLYATIFSIKYIFYDILGPLLFDMVYSISKAKWLPPSILMILCLIGAAECTEFVETKGSSWRATIRETEIYIKSKLNN